MAPDLFVLFIIGPVVTAALLAAFHKWDVFQRGVSLTVSLGLWGLSVVGLLSLLQDGQQGIVVLRMGNWAAPYGIILVADVLSMTMVVLTMTVAVAVVAFSLRTVEQEHQEHFITRSSLFSSWA